MHGSRRGKRWQDHGNALRCLGPQHHGRNPPAALVDEGDGTLRSTAVGMLPAPAANITGQMKQVVEEWKQKELPFDSLQPSMITRAPATGQSNCLIDPVTRRAAAKTCTLIVTGSGRTFFRAVFIALFHRAIPSDGSIHWFHQMISAYPKAVLLSRKKKERGFPRRSFAGSACMQERQSISAIVFPEHRSGSSKTFDSAGKRLGT